MLIITLCVILAFIKVDPFYIGNVFLGHDSHSILWFLIVYVIAYYLRWYQLKHVSLLKFPLFVLCLIILVTLNLVKLVYPTSGLISNVELTDNNSILSLGLLVSSFLIFKDMKIKLGLVRKNVFAILVPATWIVYILQEHYCIREKLWAMVNVAQYQYTSYPVLSAMVSQLMVFAVLLLLSVVIYLIYKLANRIYLGKIERFVCDKMESVGHKIFKIE